MKKNAISKDILVLTALVMCGVSANSQTNDNLYIYKNGVIMHREKAANVDSVAMEEGKSIVTLYDAARKVLYTAPRSQVDSISFTTDVPQADMLDVRFNADGTATDISPMQMNVQKIGNTQTVYYNETYKRYAANFVNPWSGNASGYYKVDWENNTKFKNMLANGHTLECIMMGNYTPPIANVEAKWFSSHQAGGTGFLISTISGSRQNEITFLPNVSTSGSSTWRWATSGVVPQPGVYYHLVGVWNKALKKAYIYVNGELKNTVNADGNFVLPQSGSGWFGIGCDPSGNNGNTAWNGDVVMARIYDSPLNAKQVSKLWEQVHILEENAPKPMVSNVTYSNGYPVAPGTNFKIGATGFQEGDPIVLQQVNSSNSITLPLENVTETGGTIIIPEELTSDQYSIILKRGDQAQRLGTCTFMVTSSMPHGMKVIAHRGYWNKAGAAQNSRASLQYAFDVQCYGSETDVWITQDGHVMANHDATFNGVSIQNSTYETCKNLTLSNGEKMPELKDFLEMLVKEDSCKLIIEIKTHSDEARGKICCDSCVTQVHRMGLQDKVEYIAFSLNLCREIVRLDPNAHVAYLNGDKDPQALYDYGIMGLDYTANNYRRNPSWIPKARELGMTTNVWTIDSKDEMIEMSNLDIDYITTNNPETAKEVYAYYQANSHHENGENDEDKPIADLLDVCFNSDGTAIDLSPMKMKIEKCGNAQNVYYNEIFKCYAANFTTPWSSKPSDYYKINFEDNKAFRDALADGHSLEVLVMPDYEGNLPDVEAKPFSAMQAGGTGFLINRLSNGPQNSFTFLPNVSTTGSSTWRWTTSNVFPQSGFYYHVIGVYNKEEAKSYIYVNGELCNTVDSPGDFRFANAGCNWFCVGGDASANGAEAGWRGDVVIARVYNKPLTEEEVKELWEPVRILEENAPKPMVANVSYSSGYPVAPGTSFAIEGTGFQEGDMIMLQQINSSSSITIPLENVTEEGGSITIPEELTTNQYTLILIRGDQTQRLGTCTFNVTTTLPHGMKVIAHRGYWDKAGSAENSRSSLQNAFNAQCYGSETDVWITLDGHVMVNHDATFNGVNIQNSNYNTCKNLTLKNGEKMPELKDFLEMLAKEDSCKLIIEIKTHSDEARGKICCDSCVTQVRRMGLQDKVEYIAFSFNLCREIVRLDPNAHVAYLNGDKDPQTLYNNGIMGLDYTAKNYRNNPTWIPEAQRLGMTTNVWTINDRSEMIEMSNLGIDYITTNAPETAKEVYEYYRTHYQNKGKDSGK